MNVDILGVKIDAVTRAEARQRAVDFLAGSRGFRVFTPNPEMLVLASRDADFKKILNTADLAIPDGIGLLLAARYGGRSLPERVTGTDLMQDLCAAAASRGWKIFLLGGENGEAAAAAAALKERHPDIKIVGHDEGGRAFTDASGRVRLQAAVLDKIKAAAPEILFVALGHGRQEKWIADNLAELSSVRVAMGIGGAFNFIAGRSLRAPRFFRQSGLEWLWRLAAEPWRWRRIWTAVVVFPYLVLKSER
jgi:N-acetylglucosaminyldiphosphoundecaprenol N-acetyl-beta-D-mannosaminyltransferase